MKVGGRRVGDPTPYRDVRSLRRGIALIEDIARHGWTKPSELSALTGIDRSSIYRLVETLVELGYVVRRAEDGAVGLTSRIREIADGVRRDEIILDRARPLLTALTGAIQWPSDLALLNGGIVTIQESTHRLSPFTFHRATVRQERSLFKSSLGRAIMMMLTPEELDILIDIAVSCGVNAPVRNEIDDLLGRYREIGYASAAGAYDVNVSAIALGFRGRNQVIGSVNIAFFRRVLTPALAAERYLPALQECVAAIQAILLDGTEFTEEVHC